MNYTADIEQSNIETTVSEEELCGKLRAWRESTSTSPSGLHFGHYKARIARHKYAAIPEDEDIPAEVLEHVFGSKFEEVRIDLDSIRQHLNNLPKTVEDFPKEV